MEQNLKPGIALPIAALVATEVGWLVGIDYLRNLNWDLTLPWAAIRIGGAAFVFPFFVCFFSRFVEYETKQPAG